VKISEKNFQAAMDLRGEAFKRAFSTFRELNRVSPVHSHPQKQHKLLRLGVMVVGHVVPGMNSAIRATVRAGMTRGHTIYGIQNGFEGLYWNRMSELSWDVVQLWTGLAGSELLCNYKTSGLLPNYSFDQIANTIVTQQLGGLILIGNWRAFDGALKILEKKNEFPAFDIPIVCIPASITNNLPHTDAALGVDTVVNDIIQQIDSLRTAAVTGQNVFVIDVPGGYCGHVASLTSIGGGADVCFVHEEGITLSQLEKVIDRLRKGFHRLPRNVGIIIRASHANPTYTSAFIQALLQEEGKSDWSTKQISLGIVSPGIKPSPYDRVLSIRCAAEAVRIIEQAYVENNPPVSLSEKKCLCCL